MPILSLTIWVPIAFGIAVLAIGRDGSPLPARWTALVGAMLGFAVCIPLWTGFQPVATMQFTEMHAWIVALPEFKDDPKKSNEKILETIQMTWHEEYQDSKS